jgi:transcriptional regulator with XRE-family HTH domain
MQQDGKYFRAFLENRKANKLQLAKDLGMSQPNLYGLFKSKSFEPDTIKNIERVLKVRWEDVLKTNISTNLSRETQDESEDYLLNSIKEMIADRNRARSVIERLTAVLEKKNGMEAPAPQAPFRDLRKEQIKASSHKR